MISHCSLGAFGPFAIQYAPLAWGTLKCAWPAVGTQHANECELTTTWTLRGVSRERYTIKGHRIMGHRWDVPSQTVGRHNKPREVHHRTDAHHTRLACTVPRCPLAVSNGSWPAPRHSAKAGEAARQQPCRRSNPSNHHAATAIRKSVIDCEPSGVPCARMTVSPDTIRPALLPSSSP